VVEMNRFTLVKRRPNGEVDFISPLPSPFAYGFAEGEMGGDGDPLDALLVGPGRPAGWRGPLQVAGVVHFVDNGQTDLKLVCMASGAGRVGPWGRLQVRSFFAAYTWAKRALYVLRGRTGPTEVRGIYWAAQAA